MALSVRSLATRACRCGQHEYVAQTRLRLHTCPMHTLIMHSSAVGEWRTCLCKTAVHTTEDPCNTVCRALLARSSTHPPAAGSLGDEL